MKLLKFNLGLLSISLECDQIFPYTWGKVIVWDLPASHQLNFGVRLIIKAPLVNKIVEFTICVR